MKKERNNIQIIESKPYFNLDFLDGIEIPANKAKDIFAVSEILLVLRRLNNLCEENLILDSDAVFSLIDPDSTLLNLIALLLDIKTQYDDMENIDCLRDCIYGFSSGQTTLKETMEELISWIGSQVE